jgi:cytoskeletal protein RodZ
MDALGTYLKENRERLNLSIEKVVEDTHIVKKFIEAIENDEFSVFPGEAYLRGFLRTYSEYLGLVAEDVIRRYEKIKMAESPTPIEQLIPKPKFDFKPVLVFGGLLIVGIAVVIGAVFLVMNISKNMANFKFEKKAEKVVEKKIETAVATNSIKMIEKSATYNLKKSDVVEFNIGSEKYQFTVKELSPAVIITDSNNKEYFLIKSYLQKIDLNNDQKNDIEVVLNYWDDKNANISLKLAGENGETITAAANTNTAVTNEGTNAASNLLSDKIETIIKKPAIENISFDINFQDETMLRYKSDDKPEIEEYYKLGNSVNINAQKSLILWLSNAGAANLNFKSYNKILKPGDTGKIEVKLIKWVQAATGEYELQIGSLK